MAKKSGKHLSREKREVIESGVRNGEPAGSIARKIGVSTSTVTREVKAHRTVREMRAAPAGRASSRCANRRSCDAVGTACPGCSTALTRCRSCASRRCIDSCPDFVPKMCPTTERWPYVCPGNCPKRSGCGYPKFRYDAGDADAAYRETLSSSRSGICVTREELDAKWIRMIREAPGKRIGACVKPVFPSSLSAWVLQAAQIDPEKRAGELTKEERIRLTETVRTFPLHVASLRGYDEAVVTKGGVSVRELDPSTMESRRIRGLYFIGEVIDVDALTGGFNLQIAWTTAAAAAKA